MSFDQSLVMYQRFQDCWDFIEECHQAYVQKRRLKNGLILGPPGVGKSALLAAYAAAHPPYEEPGRTIRPVVLAEIPSTPNATNFWTALLSAAGDPIPRAEGQMDRFLDRLRKGRTELLLFDELHHLLDRGAYKTHARLTDLLKEIVNGARIPMVVSGAIRTRRLLRLNGQLRSRFQRHRLLVPFHFLTDEEDSTHQDYLQALLEESRFKNTDFFNDIHNRRRMFFATDGTQRAICNLMVDTEELAEKAGTEELSLPLLAEGFRKAIFHGAPDRLNPFEKDFEWRRLTLPGEPYEPSQLDGDVHDWRKEFPLSKPSTKPDT